MIRTITGTASLITGVALFSLSNGRSRWAPAFILCGIVAVFM